MKASLELQFSEMATGLLDSAPVIAPDAPNLPTRLRQPGSYRFTTLTAEGNSFRVLTTAAGAIAFTKLTWTHGGQTYSLGETTSGRRPPDVSALLSLWRQVRYANAGTTA